MDAKSDGTDSNEQKFGFIEKEYFVLKKELTSLISELQPSNNPNNNSHVVGQNGGMQDRAASAFKQFEDALNQFKKYFDSKLEVNTMSSKEFDTILTQIEDESSNNANNIENEAKTNEIVKVTKVVCDSNHKLTKWAGKLAKESSENVEDIDINCKLCNISVNTAGDGWKCDQCEDYYICDKCEGLAENLRLQHKYAMKLYNNVINNQSNEFVSNLKDYETNGNLYANLNYILNNWHEMKNGHSLLTRATKDGNMLIVDTLLNLQLTQV